MTEGEPNTDRVIPQVDFEVEQLTVVVLFEGPRAAEYSRAEQQRLANEHVQYTIGLADDGYLVHAGALLDQGSDPTLTGVGFSRLSPVELRRALEKDPAVVAGMEAFRLMNHVFRKGGIEFPHERPLDERRDAAGGTKRP